MTEAKGLSILIDAVESVADLSGLSISILGDGPMRSVCEEFVGRSKIPISLLGQVKYGPDFFVFCAVSDAVIVPSVSDEQPRIIFDAFSQAVPVIGSDTGGNREIVDHRGSGILFDVADSTELGRWLQWSVSHRCDLQKMGLSALKKRVVNLRTRMHQVRSAIIVDEIRRHSHP